MVSSISSSTRPTSSHKPWLQQQHESVNAAYASLYGTNLKPSTDDTYSPQGLWRSIKKHARQHHESVGAAVENFYGVNTLKPSRA